MVGLAVSEATGGTPHAKKRPKNDVSDREVVVLGSGNLGLLYLMDEPRRMTLEEIEERHPQLVPALREHPHVGWILVRGEETGLSRSEAGRPRYLADDRVEGVDPLASFSPTAAASAPDRRLRGRRGHHGRQLLRPALDEGCAFEELISFHGGLGGPQTRAFILSPGSAAGRADRGRSHVHALLRGWRGQLQGPKARRGEACLARAVRTPRRPNAPPTERPRLPLVVGALRGDSRHRLVMPGSMSKRSSARPTAASTRSSIVRGRM